MPPFREWNTRLRPAANISLCFFTLCSVLCVNGDVLTGEPNNRDSTNWRHSQHDNEHIIEQYSRQTLENIDCADPLLEPNGPDANIRGLNKSDLEIVEARWSDPPAELACHPAEVDIVCQSIRDDGPLTQGLLDALRWARDYLPLGDRPFEATVVLDVGAHVGYFGLYAAHLGHQVIMFEPYAANRALLRWSMCRHPRLGGRVTLLPYGAGQRGACSLRSHVGNRGDGIVSCAAESASPLPGYESRGTVQLVPVEEAVGEHLRIFFLKLDVEGFELDVMRTLPGLLAKGQVAFLATEVSSNLMGGARVVAYLQLLWQAGFEVHAESFDGPVISTVAHVARLPRHVDCFCIHKSWLEAAAANTIAPNYTSQDAKTSSYVGSHANEISGQPVRSNQLRSVCAGILLMICMILVVVAKLPCTFTIWTRFHIRLRRLLRRRKALNVH